MSEVPDVEAVPVEMALQDEQQHQQYQSPPVEDPHTSFFEGDRQLDVSQEPHQPEPPTPPQRASRPDVAAEDLQLGGHGDHGDDQLQQLQLAARMSQALREVVGSSSNVEDHTYASQQDSALQSLQQLEDHSPETELHAHAHGLPEEHDLPEVHELPELPESIQPSIQQDLQQTLQQVMQHPESQEDPQPQHTPQPPPPQHVHYIATPQQHAIAPAVAGSGTQPPYSLGDMTPPRKRSKVSRACDECRRKKIKCDAASETGEESCSNCRRSNVRCMFSRIPQKRGPSKGYIKELADRINSIEGKLGSQAAADILSGEVASRRELGESYTVAALGEDLRKRTFSQISNETFPTPTTNRHQAWSSEPRPAFAQQTAYSANGLALKPILPREVTTSTPTRTPGMDSVRDSSQGPQASTVSLDVGEQVYHAYLNIIHHVLPFLPNSKDILNAHLAQCSPTLRSAFIEALDSTMKSFAAVPIAHGSLVTANRLLAEFEAEGGKHGSVSNLIYLQCLILMIINTDNYGPASLRGEHEGPNKVSLLGRAAGVAYSMALPQEVMGLGAVSDIESDQCIRARAWWSLVILDRWNSISTATPLIISGDTVVLPHNLQAILGEANYRLTLLAYIMGHWSPASVTAPENSTPGAGARASATFHLNMEMWRAHFPGDIPPSVEPVLHLSYWHCRLLAFLFMPSALLTDVTWAVKESVRLLTVHHQMISPLNHHFTSLTAICLLEMTKVEKSRDEATQMLNQLLESSIAPSAWDDAIRIKIRDILHSSTNSAAEATASQSLQHLADLATATEIAAGANAAIAPSAPALEKLDEEPKFRTSDNYDDLGFDPTMILRAGYLNSIA